MSQRILIMAGGTGGHVFPALAVARYLREQGVEVTWLGTQRGLEARVVPENDFPIEYISIAGLRGKGLLGWLLSPFRLVYAIGQSLGVIRRIKPGAVLGMGGFVTGPGGVASWLMRTPLLVHEQNAVGGLTNCLLARFARVVMQAFPNTFADKVNAELTGNPVRADIASLPTPAERFANREGPLRVLVIGGSLGALALNKTVPAAVALLGDEAQLQVRHQCGSKTHDQTMQFYKDAGVEATVTPFIEDMAEAYAWADVVICRAGALTIAELAAAGVGSVLVPYPYAVDDHQTVNGRFLEMNDAAVLLPQQELNAEVLAGMLKAFMGSRERLLNMAIAARKQARVDATEVVASRCMMAMQG